MLLFNNSPYKMTEFYNPDFNTSNVTIQHRLLIALQSRQTNFNTSNVTIQQVFLSLIFIFYKYFNTSNVTIQPLTVKFVGDWRLFQYI